LSISPGEIFYFLIFINLKLNYSENMNGPTDRSNDFCKTFGSYFRQAAEAQKKLVERTMSKVSPDLNHSCPLGRRHLFLSHHEKADERTA
jgi:hypothetical protein